MSDNARAYDVTGSINGRIQFFGKGMTLDRAQALKAELEAEGIGGVRASDTGINSGIQDAQTVDNVTVVRSADTGEALQASAIELFAVTEAATAYDGAYFDAAETIQELTALTVNGSGGIDVSADVVNGRIRVSRPVLTITDTVSASYLYKTTGDVQDGSEALTSDGNTAIYALAQNYIEGSVRITANPTGLNVFVNEGGGNLVDAGYFPASGGRANIPTASGDITVSYKYSSGEQAAAAASESTRSFSRKPVTPGQPMYPPIE